MIQFGSAVIEEGVVYEVIVSTYNDRGSPTAAPMGIIFKNPSSFVIKPYLSTATYRNLELRRVGVVNFTRDLLVFLESAFKGYVEPRALSSNGFSSAHSVRAPRLMDAELWLEFKAKSFSGKGERLTVLCSVESVEDGLANVKPFSRGDFAALECMIYGTKVLALREEPLEDLSEIARLLILYRRLAGKVAPRGVASKVVDEVYRIVSGVLPL